MGDARLNTNVWIADEIALEKCSEPADLRFEALSDRRWRSMRDTNLLACIAIFFGAFYTLSAITRMAHEFHDRDGGSTFPCVLIVAATVVAPPLNAFLAYRPLLRWWPRRLVKAKDTGVTPPPERAPR